MKKANPRQAAPTSLPTTMTGIDGLDEITGGGFPTGRPTLVCGSAGCGKTLLAMEFLVRGATKHGDPGVFMAFEETAEELAQNVKSLGFDLDDLVKRKLLAIDFVRVERSEIHETGEYDLEGLFVRLGHAIDTIGAKRVVVDTIESLFGGLSNTAILRSGHGGTATDRQSWRRSAIAQGLCHRHVGLRHLVFRCAENPQARDHSGFLRRRIPHIPRWPRATCRGRTRRSNHAVDDTFGRTARHDVHALGPPAPAG